MEERNTEYYLKYDKYDEVVSTVMRNILVERERVGKFLLYDFQPQMDADKLYFNVANVAATMRKENLYLNMPLLDYIKFRKKRGKKWSNLRWCIPWTLKKLDNEHKTSIYIIMDFIKETLDIPSNMFKDINDEYYGWVE